MSTNFLSELRQITDTYRRWELSMKQNIPTLNIELFLNINNLTSTNDVNKYRGISIMDDNLSSEQYYGRTIDLGFNYSL